MLALVGGDHFLSRDPSGGSLSNFGNLFSDEASKAELQRALQGFSQDMSPGPSFRPMTSDTPNGGSGGNIMAAPLGMAPSTASAMGWYQRAQGQQQQGQQQQ